MDSHSECVQPNTFHANGLLLKGSASVSRPLDSRRWAIAEARTAELISRIQPSWTSEKHRNAVASYVQRLISNCVPCQVFTFGSVPLKTYLPDGDIDLSAFSDEHSKKDDWANSVLDMLRREEKNEHAEFEVKEVQYIQAEVKIVKCLVDNIVVDISFNQLGGLCTLCFLEEIDYLIKQNHLFKRSVILIKAWCYYESRILGAHHGLISTYALETLVLYIFHVFNNSFAGPLEVLYRFVEFFSKFDWDNFCVSLWGPVPICSLPSMAADPPRKDGAELLLNKIFLHACSTAYSVYPGGQENQEHPFISKYFNVVDPLRINNNLGRSVSKGNFYRIRSAFSFGAQKLARILECQEEAIVAEVNQFFVNTWNRHEKGFSPDAPDAFHFRIDSKEDRNRRKYKVNENPAENSVSQYPQIDDSRSSIDFSMQSVISPVIQIAGAIDVQSPRQRDYEEESRTQVSSGRDQYYTQRKNPIKKQQNEKERNNRANILLNRRHTCPQFARTSSSPELTSISSEAAYLPAHNAATEREKEFARSSSECNRRMRGFGMENCVVNCFTDEPHTRESSSCFSHCTFDSNQSFVSNPVCSSKPVLSSCDETNQRHEDEQEFVNLMSSSGVQEYGGHFQVPVNLISHPLVSLPPSIPGFKPQLYDGAVPLNLPVRADWGDGMQYSGPSAAFTCQQFDPVGVTPEEETTGGLNGEGSVEVDHCNEDHAFWTDNYADSVREIDDESEKFFSPRLSPASPANSFRTKASSESSWDGQPSKIKNMVRYPEKKNSSSSKNPTVVVKSPWLNDGRSADQTYVDESAASSKTSSHVEVHQLPRFGQSHTSYPNSMFPLTPLLVHSDSPQGVNQNHAVPVAFYPAGLPMPFVTMVYNGSAVTGISGAPASHDDMEREKPNFHLSRSNHNSDSAKGLEQLRDGTRNCSTKKSTSGEHSDESGLDIFNSDFASHWKNLQYGRLCQNSLLQHPFMYSPSVVPPLHLQGNFSSDTPQSPYLGNPNIVAHLVPVSAQQPGSHKRAVVSRQYDGEATKNRNGTGTYFPNPKVLRDHQSSTYRQYQGDFKHERNEPHWEREANRNFSSKPRFSGHGQPRYRYDKSSSKVDRSVANGSQTDRYHDSFCRRSYHLNRYPKDPYIPKPRWNVLYDADYSVYQTHSKYHDEVSHSETAIPPLVMLYPYHPSIAYGPQIEPLQFGSVGPHHFVGADEVRELSGYPKHRDVKLQNYQGDTKGFSSKIPT